MIHACLLALMTLMRHQAQLLQCTLSSSSSDQILDNLNLWSNLATLEYPAT